VRKLVVYTAVFRFSGSMRREDAHSKLVMLPDGSFIVRHNAENGQYALSVRFPFYFILVLLKTLLTA